MMKFRFKEMDYLPNPSDFSENPLIEELFFTISNEFGIAPILATYKIIPENLNLIEFDFDNEKNFNKFISDFAEFANPLWSKKVVGTKWNFQNIKKRPMKDKIDGLLKIFLTGGPYTKGLEKDESYKLEEKFRTYFQKEDTNKLYIFCLAEYEISNGGKFSCNFEYSDFSNISDFFELMVWDDLILIINPNTQDFIVLAVTARD
ncbi:MAG: hypothetical protein ACFFCM_02235 [Promethearchaeota archaeon]